MDMPKLAQQPTVSIPTNIPSVSNQDIMPNIPSPAVATIDGVSLKQIEPIDLPISASIVFNENAIPSSLNFEMQALTAHIDKSKKSKSSEEARQESKDTEKKQSQLDNLRAQKQALLQGRNLEQLSDEERARIQAIDNEINELQAHISTPAQNTKPGAGNPTTQTTQTTFATQSSQTTFSPSQSGRYGTPDRNATASHLPEVESSAKSDSGASSASQTGYTQEGGRQRMSSSTKATDKQSKTPAQVSPITPEPTATATPTQATQTAPTPTVTPAQAVQAVPAPMTMPAQVSASALPSGEDKKKKEMQNLPPEAVVQESEEKSFWTWKNILLILAVVGTLGIGAYFIIRYKKKADNAKKETSSLQSTVNDLQAQVDDLKSNTDSANGITTGIDDGLTKSTSLDSMATNITNASLDSANTILSGNNNTRG